MKTIGAISPSAQYCVDLGGVYEILETAEGQSGFCTINGIHYDEEDLYNGLVTPTSPLPMEGSSVPIALVVFALVAFYVVGNK